MVRRGPAVASAFDASGKPTPQGEGFFKSLGISAITLDAVKKGKIKNLKIDQVKEADYLFATLSEPGKSTFALLAQELPKLILNLEFPKKMRWGNLDISYARPIHWIVALFGEKSSLFKWAMSSPTAFLLGMRSLAQKLHLKQPKDYAKELKKHYVLADIEERKAEHSETIEGPREKTQRACLRIGQSSLSSAASRRMAATDCCYI